MRSIYWQIIGLLLVLTNTGFGQSSIKQPYFGIRAGYLRASTAVTNSRDDIRLGGVAARNSFYGGVFYHRNLTPLVAYRLEVNYQQKGLENQDQNGNVLFQQRFHYVGLTPLIGITPLAGLSVFAGPEANVHFGQSAWSENAAPIEFGISGRVAYHYKWVGLEVGYFRALNNYTFVGFSPDTRFGLASRSWQAGLVLIPAKLIKRNTSN